MGHWPTCEPNPLLRSHRNASSRVAGNGACVRRQRSEIAPATLSPGHFGVAPGFDARRDRLGSDECSVSCAVARLGHFRRKDDCTALQTRPHWPAC